MKEEEFPTPSQHKRVAIITSGYLPVPNVLGGAVEALDTMLIKENETNPTFDFTVYSSWVSGIENYAQGIRHTCFVFVRIPSVIRILDRIIYTFVKYGMRKKKLMSYRYIAQRLWYIHKVAMLLSRENFDAVVVENHATLFMTMKKFGNLARYAGKVYYHLHNEVTNDFGCAHEIASVRKVLGVSNYIIDSLDRFLRKKGESGLAPEQRTVWRNCVDTKAFNPDNLETQRAGVVWRKKLGIAPDEKVLLFSGRLTPEKGALELLEAFSEVHTRNLRLVVAGAFFFDSKIASPFEIKLHEIARISGNRVVFTGFVNYGQMPGIYAMADICVLPSIWDDPAPLAVIESLASGKPIISTVSGGIPEYINDESSILLARDTNLIHNLSKAMVKLSSEPGTSSLMGMNARDKGKELNPRSYLIDLQNKLS